MSRTYRYPSETIEDSNAESSFEERLKIIKRFERKKFRKKIKRRANRSFMDMIRYRDRERSKV
ncbi:MAG: hypothetical protein IKS41_05750 [Alphaproteobacteria bacterium]|nr:hypothetical protein [Alphaproteobacteria bacterium]